LPPKPQPGATPVAAAATATTAASSAEPGSIAPQQAKRKPPVVREKTKPSRKLKPGDLICGQCGEGNPPSRKFCSRCGNSLETAKTVKTPWWRKIIPHRKPKTLEAGARPGKGGQPGVRKGFHPVAMLKTGLGKVLAIALPIFMLLILVVPSARSWAFGGLGSLKDKISSWFSPQYEQIHAFEVPKASSAVPGHPAVKAFDGFSNTFWAAQAGDAQPHLIVQFSQPVSIDKIILRNGASDQFDTFNRVKQLKFVFPQGSYTVNAQDVGDPKTYSIKHGHNVARFEIDVVSQYPALEGQHQLAITELSFFQQK
jgi:hypothetical protein